MHRTRNAAYGQPYRGFESLPLRHRLTRAVQIGEGYRSPDLFRSSLLSLTQRGTRYALATRALWVRIPPSPPSSYESRANRGGISKPRFIPLLAFVFDTARNQIRARYAGAMGPNPSLSAIVLREPCKSGRDIEAPIYSAPRFCL